MVEIWAPVGVLQARVVGPTGGRHVIKIAIKKKVKKAIKGYVVSVPCPIANNDCHYGLGGFGGDPMGGIYVDDRGHSGHGVP